MDVIEFDYKHIFPSIPEKQPILRATIWVQGQPIPYVHGIIDSGSDYTTLPLSMLSSLKLDVKKLGTPRPSRCACGKDFVSYICEGEIEIAGHRFPLKLSLSSADTTPLFGRHGIFDYFTVVFDRDRKKVIFKK